MEVVKPVKGHYLYNMLQDYRHVFVIDLRKDQQWGANHIRDSYNLTEKAEKQQIEKIVETGLRKAEQKQQKYKQLKKVRRYFFIGLQAEEHQERVSRILEIIPKDKDNKIYSLKESYTQFYTQYPYVCVLHSSLEALMQKNTPKTEIDRWLLYPYCRFPSQIIIGQLFLGGIFSSNSEKILGDMKIKSLVDFIDYEAKEAKGEEEPDFKKSKVGKSVPDFKKDESKYNYLHIPLNKDVIVEIDFDIICAEIDKKMKEGRVLLYCDDGQTISSAFAIAYLMFKSKLDVTMATLKVCQAISRTDINKWIYSQLLTYKPK